MSASQLDRVRAMCLSLPETFEKPSHGAPNFWVHKRVFAVYADNTHSDGHLGLWLPVPMGMQPMLLDSEPAIYFHPPYVGVRGWVGIELPEIGDEDLRFHIVTAWELVAPKRLLKVRPLA